MPVTSRRVKIERSLLFVDGLNSSNGSGDVVARTELLALSGALQDWFLGPVGLLPLESTSSSRSDGLGKVLSRLFHGSYIGSPFRLGERAVFLLVREGSDGFFELTSSRVRSGLSQTGTISRPTRLFPLDFRCIVVSHGGELGCKWIAVGWQVMLELVECRKMTSPNQRPKTPILLAQDFAQEAR